MKKQSSSTARQKPILSPIMDDECDEPHQKPWAITQQETTRQGRRPRAGKDPKTKGDGKPERTALPVLGSLSMKIETSTAYESDRKATHDILYRNKLLRTKKQKSIEGMFQAAKANKELSQILLNTNPSFNLDIGEHNLHKYLAPSRHLSMEDVVDEDHMTEVISATTPHTMSRLSAPPLPPPPESAVGDEPEEMLSEDRESTIPPPLTAHDLFRRSKVIEALAPSTLWQPSKSFDPPQSVKS